MATVAAAAGHLFLSERRFHELLDAGVIERQGRGAYDLDAVRRQYIEHLRGVASGHGGGIDDGDLDLVAERARLAKAQADAQEMKNAVSRQDLIPRQSVVAGITETIAHCRAKLLSVPAKAASAVVGVDSLAEVNEILTCHVHEALEELSRTRAIPRPSGGELGDDDSSDGVHGRVAPAAKADGKRVGRQRKAPQPRGKRRTG